MLKEGKHFCWDNKRNMKYTIFILVVLIHQYNCVEVHFEAADSGFFLKHSRQAPVAPEISNIQSSSTTSNKIRPSYNSILSVDRFTVVQTIQPVSIRASYGPFSTKQTVPARYIVPDTIENQGDYLNNTTAALLEMQQSNLHLDISAHLVRSAISQDSPVLRVLFHAGADPGGHLQRQKICVLLHVSLANQTPLKGRCMPEGEDGVCVAEVIIPFDWWPSIPPPKEDNVTASKAQKVPQRLVQVSYSVFEPPQRNPEQCEPKVQIQPLTTFGQVPLISATAAFKEIRADKILTILIPQYPLFPMSKIHVPVFLRQLPDQRIAAFTMKARVKSGIKILGATASSDAWNISIEKENTKHTTARVTAFRKKDDDNVELRNDSSENVASTTEVFYWLLEVADDTTVDILDGGKIVWSVTYVLNNPKVKDASSEDILIDETKKRLIAKLEVNKDDIQAVLPMAKNWELMNTAVLTGRQVSQAMKVFIVSQAGKVADVTLQTSCHAEDESVIKVSSSCSSVYVDGSEIRGSSNASVIVKYGTYIGLAKFTVWMPEFPLEVYISDFRLSQIKGWKVLDDNFHLHNKQSRKRKKRSYVWGQHNIGFYNNEGTEKMGCRARYQQSPVEVYARFLAVDQNSGRISYFISRRTFLRVTDLVQPVLRVADPKIATLKGRILQGKSMGRTDVQVLSPITGRVIGTKEIRVGSDKVSLSKVIVRVVSGLQLTISPDNTIENGYIAETSVTHKLTAQYQEGLLDIDLEFSDGSKTPLRDISVEDYFLLVESLDTEVVAFAPMLASHHPRVIAVGEGNGNLLRITLLLSEDCRMRRNSLSPHLKTNISPLASALASVEVDFNNVESVNKHDSVQNDGIIGKERKSYRNNGDLADIIVGIPLSDSGRHYEPTIQSRQHHRGSIKSIDKLRHEKKIMHNDLTAIEMGMYILLTAFCFAIIVFVVSCVVYASKFRPIINDIDLEPSDSTKGNFTSNIIFREPRSSKEATTNVHDWVWLGRSTIDKSTSIFDYPRDSRVRITNNPFVNYAIDKNTSNVVSSFNTSFENQNNFIEDNNACNVVGQVDKSFVTGNDYKPPIPPHRNIRAQTGASSVIEPTAHLKGSTYEYQARQRADSNNDRMTRTVEDMEYKAAVKECQQPRQVIEHIQHSLPEKVSSTRVHKSCNRNDMHNAERLIENSNHQQKNVFQFDSLTPKRRPKLSEGNDEYTECNKRNKNPMPLSKNDTNMNGSNENNGFVTSNCEPQLISKRSRVKRATVVGNPMFSSALDNNVENREYIGLDDLDMDYEQIMNYFDNLKESNA